MVLDWGCEAVAMPRVKTDDPAMAMAEPKSAPLAHQTIRPKPITRSASQEMKRRIMEAGPINDISRSRAS
jgi:hypothetical protein